MLDLCLPATLVMECPSDGFDAIHTIALVESESPANFGPALDAFKDVANEMSNVCRSARSQDDYRIAMDGLRNRFALRRMDAVNEAAKDVYRAFGILFNRLPDGYVVNRYALYDIQEDEG